LADSADRPAPSRWQGAARADDYDAKWKLMADRGEDPHGEVAFVQRFDPTTVLDAGCGTGRVATELAARGVHAVGTDVDEHMLGVAREKAPQLEWVCSDLAELQLGRTFDVVVMAGNIILFVTPGTEAAVVAGAGRHVAAGGFLIAGFQLGRGVEIDQWEQWLISAGLQPLARHGTWSGDEFQAGGDYLVSVAQRPESSP